MEMEMSEDELDELRDVLSGVLDKFTILHKVLILYICNWDGRKESLYWSVQFAWWIDVSRAKKVDYILVSHNRKIIKVYVADEWLPATDPYFAGRYTEPATKRYGFVGREADKDIQDYYVGRYVEDEIRSYGFPFRYFGC